MNITGRKILTDLSAAHADVREAVSAWTKEVENAQWKTPSELKARYPTVSFVNEYVVFNLKGNRYRLRVLIDFALGIVVVDRAGTHAEYDSWSF